MPEGPEIRRAADALAAAVVGTPLERVEFAFPALKGYEAALVGHCIEAIVPHGKALLTRFDQGLTLYTHNQLYGVWKIVAAGVRPATRRSLRVALQTATTAILLYSASDVAIWPTESVHTHPFLQRIGPDVLDPLVSTDAVDARLDSPRFRGRALSALLLDQAFLAGMGNYLRSEVLFRARIAPQRRPRDLDDAQRRTLAEALLAIPRQSYLTRGIRRARGMRADYLTDTPQGFRFRVFDRAGEPCETCASPIVRSEAGGRRLYWCPHCQH
jgi:endonuclease-8